MPRITISELCYMLENQDADLNMVIVEGLRDLLFWKRILPLIDRDNAEIWSIDAIDESNSHQGNRGRLIRLAEVLEQRGLADRVLVFVDADFDRILEVKHGENVCLTDFRDLEGYAYNEKGCDHFAFVFNKPELEFANLQIGLEGSLKFVSSIRLISSVDGEHLSVNDSIKSLKKREFTIDDGIISIERAKFLKKVIQNSNISLNELNRITDRVEALGARFDTERSKDHVHGKDLIRLLSILFGCDLDEMERQVWGAINVCIDDIRQLPAIRRTLEFLNA